MILNQVKTYLTKLCIKYTFLRYTHNEHKNASKVLISLRNRKLIHVIGNDASTYLQGLITNDMRHLENSKSMYTMFLNNKGRVLYDALIHKWVADQSFLIECDSNILNLLQKHLKMYKLKRNVEIKDINEEFQVWAMISPENTISNYEVDNIYIYPDPRLVELGFRIIAGLSIQDSQITEIFGNDIIVENSEDAYVYLRYKLGVCEGSDDLPPGTTFPLEVNCDYLHGVSFHKGCYIGQELTARVHHTGVVRKRIMPLKFRQSIKDPIPKDTVITPCDNSTVNLGKLKGVSQDYGLGLIRIKEALDKTSLKVGDYTADVIKPSWWPIEAPREVICKKE